MNSSVKVWHLLSAIVGVMLALMTVVYNSGVKIGTIEIRVSTVEARQVNFETRQELTNARLEQKQDKILDNINSILVTLQDKQDRKK